jgi:hypothetical protein
LLPFSKALVGKATYQITIINMAENTTTNGISPLKVAIVGGGIGGVLLALGLQKYAHIDYQLYEAAPTFGEVGLGVAIGPNAQKAFEIIDPRARNVLNELASTNVWESHLNDFVIYRSVRELCTQLTIWKKKRELRSWEKLTLSRLGLRRHDKRNDIHAKGSNSNPHSAPRASARRTDKTGLGPVAMSLLQTLD